MRGDRKRSRVIFAGAVESMDREFAKVDQERAKEIGQVAYWPEKPCRRGHLCWRYTSTKACVRCHREATKRYQARQHPQRDHLRHVEAAIDERSQQHDPYALDELVKDL